MRFLHKHQQAVLLGVFLVFLYCITRLFLLTNLPIFTDEAIYIRWAQIALHDSNWWFISLTDGKQPLFIWIMMGFLAMIKDPLLAGRLVSVVIGLFSLLGLWLLTYALFKNKGAAWVSVVLYIFFPLALLHDRLAIYDTLVATLYIYSLYCAVLFIRSQTFTAASILGIAFGASVLNKSSGFISMGLLPIFLLLFNFKQKAGKQKLLRLIGLGILSVAIGLVFYNLLRISAAFYLINIKNGVFVYPLSEWLQESVDIRIAHFLGNMHGLIDWFNLYMSFPYILFLLIGLWNTSFIREKFILIIYFLLPILYLGIFGRVIFPRYILFMCVILFPIVAYGISLVTTLLHKRLKRISTVALTVLFVLLIILPNAYTDYLLITNPLEAPIADIDKGQYIGGWPAGWGVTEAVDYISNLSKTQKIYIGSQGTFGLTPGVFEIYFYQNKNVITKGYWPITQTIPEELVKNAQKMPTYIYFYEPCDQCPSLGVAPKSWPVQPVFTIEKNNGNVHVTLYRVIP